MSNLQKLLAMDPDPYNHEDVKENKIRKLMDYNKVFSTQEGKRVFSDLMNLCGVASVIFVEHGKNLSMIQEGKRRVGIHILENLVTPVSPPSREREPLTEDLFRDILSSPNE